MSGQEIYNKYQSFRDYSGSPDDEYAQLLDTIRGHLYLSAAGSDDDFFALLTEAERQGKKLDIKDPFPDNPNICWDELTPDHIELV